MARPAERARPEQEPDGPSEWLGRILRVAPRATVVGEQGTWLRVGGLRSHQIELVVDHGALGRVLGLVSISSDSWSGTWRHRRGPWNLRWAGGRLRLHVPYAAHLGRVLGLRIERLGIQLEPLGGCRVLEPTAHVASRVSTLVDHWPSMRAMRHVEEIVSLADLVDARDVVDVIAAATTRPLDEVRDVLTGTLDRALDAGSDVAHRRERWALRRDWVAAAEAVSPRSG